MTIRLCTPGWLALLVTFLCVHVAGAQISPPASTLSFETGKQIWDAGCAACHGADGRGQADNLRGFELPATFPDFSDCPTSTPESDIQWRAVITNGGPARGFSQIMPAFRDLLTQEQIGMVISHVRTLCTEPAWPQGDLNLPRPLVTEKAFPENETVIAGAINAQGPAGVASSVIYERRFGSTAMVEVIVPYAFTHETGTWGAAFGDLALGYKQKLLHDVRKGSIFSVGGELIAPTGSREQGTGGESTVFEGYAAYGQMFRGLSFLQLHTGIELPAHPDKVAKAYYLRTAIGKTFAADAGHGRRWTPMMEFIADRELVTGSTTNWDVVPQLQIPLNRRMHVLASIGYRVPVNNTSGRQRQWLFYGLWDWMDGGLLQGW
jgi:mono/diheme cytochrome c family protein